MNSTYENLRECLEKLDRVSNFDNKLKVFSEILIEATKNNNLMSEARNINEILKQCKNDKLRENNLKFIKWIREAKDSNKFTAFYQFQAGLFGGYPKEEEIRFSHFWVSSKNKVLNAMYMSDGEKVYTFDFDDFLIENPPYEVEWDNGQPTVHIISYYDDHGKKVKQHHRTFKLYSRQIVRIKV